MEGRYKLIFYLSLAVIFWAFAFPRVNPNSQNRGLIFAVIIAFILLAGLRLETGFDWKAYEQALTDAPLFAELLLSELPSSVKMMEPLFVLLISVIKECGGTIQVLYFTTALFNGIVFYVFVRHCRANIFLAFAIYFCWVYFPVQMGVVRQSIALSFMMLSLIHFDKSKYVSSLVLFLVGVFFQYSLLIFIPIFFTFIYRKILRYTNWILITLVVLYFFSTSPFDGLAIISQNIGFSFVAEKMQVYVELGAAPKSTGAAVYFLLNIFVFLYFKRTAKIASRLEKSLMLSILLMIAMQSAFWQFPLLWNRVQYFVVIAQSILLCRTWANVSAAHRTNQFLTVFVLSAAILIKFLNSDSAMTFVPYQSVLTDNKGDGQARTEEYYEIFEESIKTPKTSKSTVAD